MDLPYLKPATATDNAKYRRRVPESYVNVFGKKNVEWSLGTKDPLEIVEQWKIAHTRFEAMLTRKQDVSEEQIVWEMTHAIAMKYGLANATDSRIGPVDFEHEKGLFQRFTEAIREEDAKLTPQQMQAKFANAPALSPVELLLKAQHEGIRKPRVTLEEVQRIYIREHLGGDANEDQRKNIQRVHRNFKLAFEALGGDIALADLGKAEAKKVRDHMLSQIKSNGEKKSPSSVRRELNVLKAAINFTIEEMELHGTEALNPFGKLDIPQTGATTSTRNKRDPLPPNILREVRERVLTHASADLALIWRLLEGTGCRLAEVTGLRMEDIDIIGGRPTIRVEWHEERRIKTKASIRYVPLVGDALEAAKDARRSAGNGPMLFTSYSGKNGPTNASAALMKHVRHFTSNEKHVVHSLRHNMADWLSLADVQERTRNLILGHALGGVGSRTYGGSPADVKTGETALQKAFEARVEWEADNQKWEEIFG
ncbi:tyrosine-type recombinase/integrase [Celeribacter sp.]|uniref:tyrosine-type recombinase/integrase n=1 Tax=Celeribacter sp. TaxID=1890673 RepID=UPI003A926D8F